MSILVGGFLCLVNVLVGGINLGQLVEVCFLQVQLGGTGGEGFPDLLGKGFFLYCVAQNLRHDLEFLVTGFNIGIDRRLDIFLFKALHGGYGFL